MLNTNILETIRMIEEQKLDIRTVTMGISLLDFADCQQAHRRHPHRTGGRRLQR